MKVLLSEKVLFQSLLLDLVSLDGILSFIIVQKVFLGPCETHYQSYLFHYLIFFLLNNLFCCLNSEISILWYIINIIKLQILKHLQKGRWSCLSFKCSYITCNIQMLVKTVPSSYLFLCFNCLFTYHWDIIPPTFEWHFSYISQW